MHTDSYFIIGAGGHAKVVCNAIQLLGMHNIEIWDDDSALIGQRVLGVSINIPIRTEGMVDSGHVAIGNNGLRRQFSSQLVQAGKRVLSVIHPDASVAASAELHDGSFIAASSILGPDCKVANGTIVNHGAVVDHDCLVGAYSHVAPNATLGGGVRIGENCLIGAGAVILPGVSIVDGVTVGAGAVVVSDITQTEITVLGVPAK